jgi:hypothetical protein
MIASSATQGARAPLSEKIEARLVSALLLGNVGGLLLVTTNGSLADGAGANIGETFVALDVNGTDLGLITIEDTGDLLQSRAPVEYLLAYCDGKGKVRGITYLVSG